MKINLIFIVFILTSFYPCKDQERKTICKNKFDLNSITFKNKNELNKIFRLDTGFYGIYFRKNKEWLINKNDIRGYLYKIRDTSTCICFFNEKIIANKDYAIYLDSSKKYTHILCKPKALKILKTISINISHSIENICQKN
ncbi:hypothetical protein GSQ57_01180 [Flavobacterium columnare]|uniref:hypothetical protein n=1 Tax=Flavobacterium columnare TaxID=996 RepID=UPI0017871D12|nr:hypothetical protein [Flavobacterium columnare]QOH23311.1 hypothetical protein GSQ57_01180 [Flavobacterium columnare]